MNILTIYGHPYEKSFSNGILNNISSAVSQLSAEGHVIDLHKDNFAATKNKKDVITKYTKLLNEADVLIITTPIWWTGTPAIIQSFFEQILKEAGSKNKLKTILCYTTSTAPNIFLNMARKNPVKNAFLKHISTKLDVSNVKYRNLGTVGNSLKKREKFLTTITKDIRGLHE